MPVIITEIETTELCQYGCGQVARYKNKSGKLMCCKSSNSCPENKKKNSSKLKKLWDNGEFIRDYSNYSQETKSNMLWSKGKTAAQDDRIVSGKNHPNKGIRWGSAVTGHSQETKDGLSSFKTAWLKDPANHKKIELRGKSWMELCFEKWLTDNAITGWTSEKHFFNDALNKNYFVDFAFEEMKILVELDGTQHRKTVEQDRVRDEYLTQIGYTVIRIQHAEFKERYFSGRGFNDLLRL